MAKSSKTVVKIKNGWQQAIISVNSEKRTRRQRTATSGTSDQEEAVVFSKNERSVA